ncbi:MAG: transglutaminase domain-containing protein [Bacteroidota bacterium]
MLLLRRIFLVLAISWFTSGLTAQDRYRGHPVISAEELETDYRLGDAWFRGWWSIAPELAHDTLSLTLYAPSEDFAFYTDRDSITFPLTDGTIKDFYVRLPDGQMAHTIVQATVFTLELDPIAHATTPVDARLRPYYASESPFLDSLAELYPINPVAKNELDLVAEILQWTHQRWEHSGNHSPSKSDALTILEEAAAGGRFPCFAYAIVLRDQLTVAGFAARTIYLKTADAATRQGSPGHVATEVYLPESKRWVFLDGQFGLLPVLDGRPLNAVEFQQALANDYADLAFLGGGEISKAEYAEFVADYLFYLDTSLDHRSTPEKRYLVDDKRSMMLVPTGAPELSKVSFWDMDVDYVVYTRSLGDFYAAPR